MSTSKKETEKKDKEQRTLASATEQKTSGIDLDALADPEPMTTGTSGEGTRGSKKTGK